MKGTNILSDLFNLYKSLKNYNFFLIPTKTVNIKNYLKKVY